MAQLKKNAKPARPGGRNGTEDAGHSAAGLPGGVVVNVYADLVGSNAVTAIRKGLPTSAVDDIVNSGAISSGELYEIVLPRKTLSNRRSVGILTSDQSDKLVRVARVIAKAEQTFGNPEKAHRWLRRPTTPLDGEKPLMLLDTEAGARKVEELLLQIDHGIAA